MISAKFVPLKYYTLSSQLQRLTSFSVGSANSVTRPDRRNAKMVYKAQICNVEALICHFYKNIKTLTHYISYMHYFEPVSFSTKSYRSSVRRTLRFKSDSPTDAKFYVSVS